MAKGLPRSMNRGSPIVTGVKKVNIPVNAALTMTGASGVGWGTAVVGDLPEGNILLLGAVFTGTLTEASSSISNTFNGDIAVGSAPATNASLSGTKGDIIPSTSTPAAVSSVSTVRAASTTTEGGSILDNTDGSLELNMNLMIDDADISADSVVVTAAGVLSIAYIVLGDD